MPWAKQFDVDEALAKAMRQFWMRGYEATSIQDLLRAMGIRRGSMYDTFGDKRALFLAALRRYDQTHIRRTLADAGRGRPAREAIEHLFDILVADALDDGDRCGCFLVNTALELAPHDAEAGVLVARSFADIEAHFRHLIERGQTEGGIPCTVEPDETARGLLGLMVGIRALARGRPEEAVLRSIANQAVRMLG